MAKTLDTTQAYALRQAFDNAVLGWPQVRSRQMFGYPAYTANGALFAVLAADGIVLTGLNADQRSALASAMSVEPFHARGRIVHHWAQVAIHDTGEIESLLPFVRQSYQTALAEADEWVRA